MAQSSMTARSPSFCRAALAPTHSLMSHRERQFRPPAIILKRFDLGEADRLLTLLTPRHGKIEVVAKGARKLTSAKTGHVELFTLADMLIHRGRDLGIAAQAELEKPYLGLRENLTLGAY